MSFDIPQRPLGKAPRWVAILVLGFFLLAGGWNAVALGVRDTAHVADIEQRLDKGEKVDMDLYRQVHAAVARGEDYYQVALQGNRDFTFPTKPFVTVRTPILAWGAALWGDFGWRAIAVLLWMANAAAWFVALNGQASRRERDAAGTLSLLFGAAAFIPEVAFSHELVGGLLISLALALSSTRWWIGALVAAVLGIAVRELAAPFVLAWAALALLTGRRRELAGVLIAGLLVAIGLWLHAQGVAGARLPGDETSPGWLGMFGPSLPLYGIHVTTLLQVLPNWLAGPLGVLPLLGWIALGGRSGALATLWFAGFIAATAIFARQENFYWMGLFVPAYGVGLAFVPRALADLWRAIRPAAVTNPTPA
ncbi:hypothetical protein [Qipengyuania sp. RANM35]|uniref:hypothetical protein n=1 Tax=Qipengyuania sp. RANM35 TaxID=3068635 RepID=UPI0034DAE6BF